jgi:hypothetical protein
MRAALCSDAVETPVTWDELAQAVEAGDPGSLTFLPDDVP